MTQLGFIPHIFIGATLAGVGIVVVLVAGLADAGWLGGAVLGGFGLGFPVARVVARALGDE